MVADEHASGTTEHAYRHRIAFGCWINDMRNSALPLQQWPAPELDDCTVAGIRRALEVTSDAGFGYLDSFGLYATGNYPLDIVSAFTDPERNRGLDTIFEIAAQHGMRMSLPLGLMTWGYDRIIVEDPEVRGKDHEGNPHPHAMCGAKEKSWAYIEKLIDVMFERRDFGGVHLESADLGYCMCPECTGQYGVVGYNARLNARAAQYIKAKHPEVLVYVCPISWVPFCLDEQGRQPKIGAADMPQMLELSKHIDIFMDQGHHGRLLEWEDAARLDCAYGTSGGLWAYHGSRLDRLSYFLPYPRRAAGHLRDHYDHGARACLYYQGPMANPAVEVNSAVAGRVMGDVRRDAGEVLREVIETYYRPRHATAGDRLAEIYLGIEEAYFGRWDEQRFKAGFHLEMPGEFVLGNLFNRSPDAATFLAEPYLDGAGRAACRVGLRTALTDLASLAGEFDDEGRIERMTRCLAVMHQLLATVMMARGEAWMD
jgi:hypothetical protein